MVAMVTAIQMIIASICFAYRHYIARAFGACHNDQQKDSVERFLKVELRDIFEEKREWKINWDTYPLPM